MTTPYGSTFVYPFFYADSTFKKITCNFCSVNQLADNTQIDVDVLFSAEFTTNYYSIYIDPDTTKICAVYIGKF